MLCCHDVSGDLYRQVLCCSKEKNQRRPLAPTCTGSVMERTSGPNPRGKTGLWWDHLISLCVKKDARGNGKTEQGGRTELVALTDNDNGEEEQRHDGRNSLQSM